MYINVKLIDNEQLVHMHAVWPFSMKSKVNQIMETVKTVWLFDILHLELYHNGRRITTLDLSFEQLNIKNQDEVFLKHDFLKHWYEYKEYYSIIKDRAKSKIDRTTFAKMGMQNSKMLENAGFFQVYVQFSAEWRNMHGEFMRFVDRTEPALRSSACSFFPKLFPNCELDFLEKTTGTRAGIIVKVINNTKETKYFMKTYHHAGSSASLQTTTKRHLPDLREMLAYRIINYLGVGPTVFFPYYEGSIYIYYICTEEVPGFKELDNMEEELSLQKIIIVEAYLLSLILGLRDVNEGNFGVNNFKSLCIIDFYIPDTDSFLKHDIVNEFKNKSNFGGLGKCAEILPEIKSEDRMKIAKEALVRWNKIKNMDSGLIVNEKKELRNHGIKFGSNTVDIDQYLSDIKANYDSMCLACK